MTETDIKFGVASDIFINTRGAHRATLFSRFDPSVSVASGAPLGAPDLSQVGYARLGKGQSDIVCERGRAEMPRPGSQNGSDLRAFGRSRGFNAAAGYLHQW